MAAAATGLVLVSALAATALVGDRGGAAADPDRLRVAVVGDGYSAGVRNRVVWPTLMAERTGWEVSNFALPGTGYVADGAGGQAFTFQVDRARAAAPDVIVVFGGVEDAGLPETDSIGVGAVDAINKITLGGERALVIGPPWYQYPVPAAVTRVSDEVDRVARSTGTPYLDASNPPLLTPDLMQADLSWPSDDGQAVLADRIAVWIRSKVGR
ncbi:SGNH/GDSL hydrolase family protein [Rhodococcus sp. NPDC003318]|uniref:SGNH/GDSL hydrolase family protein n=1 Tax=Rhodococcus sp. NPDC003318 TaxID=3364503 RepID=UPI00368D5204